MWLNGRLGMCTKGSPSPSVQKAMLTPSPVVAYWMGGASITPPSSPRSRTGPRARPGHPPLSARRRSGRCARGWALRQRFYPLVLRLSKHERKVVAPLALRDAPPPPPRGPPGARRAPRRPLAVREEDGDKTGRGRHTPARRHFLPFAQDLVDRANP